MRSVVRGEGGVCTGVWGMGGVDGMNEEEERMG